jgi:hypothetical protein
MARARVLGRELRWHEFPFEWLESEFYCVQRIFETGPFTKARIGVDLHEQPGGVTRVVAYSELTPRNVFGKWLARRLLGPKAKRDMQRIAAHIEEFLRGRAKVVLPRLPVQPVNEVALQSGLKKLADAGQPAELVQRFESFLRESPDVELSHIRPLAVARHWGRDQWEILGLFLNAPHCGPLDGWEILCRTAVFAGAPAGLRQLKRSAHLVCQNSTPSSTNRWLKFAVNPGDPSAMNKHTASPARRQTA